MKKQRHPGEADEANREMWRFLREENWAGFQERVAKGEWDPNRPLVMALSPGGDYPLHIAASHGQMALARQLLELGAEVNGRMPGETAPLMAACEEGDAEMVELLLQHGAKADTKCVNSDEGDPGETALMEVAGAGNRAILELLLRHGARIDATTRRGRSALSLCVDRHKPDMGMVQFLLDAGCPVDGRDLHPPIVQRNLELFQLLMARKPDVNKRFDWPTCTDLPNQGDTPLLAAVARNSVEIFSTASLDFKTRAADRIAIIQQLIASGADVNVQRTDKAAWTVLMLAVHQDDDEVARLLIAAGADPAKETVTIRNVEVGENWEVRNGPLSAIGMAEELPKNKKIRTLLLGA